MPPATPTAVASRSALGGTRRPVCGLRSVGSTGGQNLALLKPKPVRHVAGEKDALVIFAWQQQTMNALRKLNECGEGKPWAKDCTVFESKVSAMS